MNGGPASSQRLHEAAWPDMLANLQTAYADLAHAKFEIERRAGEIEETRDLFQRVIESMSEALFLTDPGGRVMRTNPSAGALLECDGTELLDRPFAEVCGSDEVPATPWQLLRRAPTGTLPNLEAEIRTRAGRPIAVNVSCGLVRDKRGKIIGMLAVVRNITYRKRAEQLQAGQHAVTRILAEATALVEATPQIVRVLCESLGWELGVLWTVDRHAGVLRCVDLWHVPSLDAAEFEAVSRHRTFAPGVGLPGRVWSSGESAWIADVVRDPNFPRAPVAARAGLHSAFGFPIVLSREVLGVLEFFSREIRQPDDDLLKVMTTVGSQIGQFIERRRTEEASLRLAFIVRSSDDAIVSKTLEGVITSWNPAAERMFGYTAQEAVGQPITIIIPADRIAEEDEVLRRLRRGEGIDHYETVRVRKDGGLVYVSLSVSPVGNAAGRIVGASKIIRDITERRRLEEERTLLFAREQAARAEAEAANRAKDEFLATLSHELRTPLSAILGWARMLRTTKLPEDQAARALETIERNARLQAQLVEDVLDVSRVITGKLRLDVRLVELQPIIEAALDVVRPAADAKAIRLEATLAPSVGPISADPDRLQQVVWNLLSNAVKFTPNGGRIEVRLENADAHVRITVSDTGKGINPDFLPHVFDRFRQADSSITKAHGGLGLGLAIVRQLVELHGGTVHALSRGEGHGATFTVYLPLMGISTERSDSDRPFPMLRDEVRVESTPALGGLRILVVEDEADSRELFTAALQRCGAEVIAAASATEALEAIDRLRPDVLLSDIGMPGIDGYELIRRVRRLESGRGERIPALALTAYASPEDRARALAAGFDRHAAKPAEPADLAKTVAAMAGRTASPPGGRKYPPLSGR
ncbi:MAG: PAS domain S-box protein [Candidatus Rokuibacteriota bacterium]